LAPVLTNNYIEGIASDCLTPLRRDELRKVERGFNTKGHDSNILPEPLNVYQPEFRSRIVDLTPATLNVPSSNDSDGQVPSPDVVFGVGQEEDMAKEDVAVKTAILMRKAARAMTSTRRKRRRSLKCP
jgi:hypothetical protein